MYELPNSEYICSDCVDWLVDQVAIVIEGGGLKPAAPDRAEPQLENYGGKMVLTHPGHNE